MNFLVIFFEWPSCKLNGWKMTEITVQGILKKSYSEKIRKFPGKHLSGGHFFRTSPLTNNGESNFAKNKIHHCFLNWYRHSFQRIYFLKIAQKPPPKNAKNENIFNSVNWPHVISISLNTFIRNWFFARRWLLILDKCFFI